MVRMVSRLKNAAETEAELALALIKRISLACPRREATTDGERKAHHIVAEEMSQLGLTPRLLPFYFNDSNYKNLALHFGVGTLGTMVGGLLPLFGAALHGLAASSYWADSTRKAYILRRTLGFKESQNVMATLPAKGRRDLRVVFLAHVDAAFTGMMFHPKAIKMLATDPPRAFRFISRSLALATRTEAALAVSGVLRALTWPFGILLRPLELVLGIPGALAFLLALEVVVRDEVVPGAADNLSGVAGMMLLLARFIEQRPDNAELVFVATGAEEAGLGGADALAEQMKNNWNREDTLILALDTLSNGALHFVEREGEVMRTGTPAWLSAVLREVAASEPRFAEVKEMEIPVGGTDAAPFLYRGYAATCLTCIDPVHKAPEHYHQPSDVPEHIDPAQIVFSVDFAEKLVRQLALVRSSACSINTSKG